MFNKLTFTFSARIQQDETSSYSTHNSLPLVKLLYPKFSFYMNYLNSRFLILWNNLLKHVLEIESTFVYCSNV